MTMMITTTAIITVKIRESAVAEEDHEIRKGGGGEGGMIHYTPSAFRQGYLEGFNAVAMNVAWAVLPGSRVCKLYAGVGVLGLTDLSYHHCMSKVEEDDDYDDYGGGGRRPLRWLRCSNENTTNTRCFDRSVGSM